jgi:hypothetical protein
MVSLVCFYNLIIKGGIEHTQACYPSAECLVPKFDLFHNRYGTFYFQYLYSMHSVFHSRVLRLSKSLNWESPAGV